MPSLRVLGDQKRHPPPAHRKLNLQEVRMRQSAPVHDDGESGNAPTGAPAEDVDQFDRDFAYVALTAVVAVAAIALLAFFWPSV